MCVVYWCVRVVCVGVYVWCVLVCTCVYVDHNEAPVVRTFSASKFLNYLSLFNHVMPNKEQCSD